MAMKALVFIPPNTALNRQSWESSLISTTLGLVSTAGLWSCVCCTGQSEIEEHEELLYAKILVLETCQHHLKESGLGDRFLPVAF